MFIKMTNPNISSYEIEKISGRRNIGMWLASKGILRWEVDMTNWVFWAEVVDEFDLSILQPWGTVEVIEEYGT